MGQKVNPICLRLGITQSWSSRWFASTKLQFRDYLREDYTIRGFLEKELDAAAVAKIEVERSPDRVRVLIHTARPGVLIGRRGENIQRLQEAIQKIVGTQKQLKMDYVEIGNPYVQAVLIGKSIAFQLEKRVAYRRAMKRAIQQALEGGAQGVKIITKGRLGGSEMTRRETYRQGKVPLGTLRADIEYGEATAHTIAGTIGIKVWIYKGGGEAVARPSPKAVARTERHTVSASPGESPAKTESATTPATTAIAEPPVS
jgi:small subunit ribosomal protein S3